MLLPRVSFPVHDEISSSKEMVKVSQKDKLNVSLGDDGKTPPSKSNPKTLTISIPEQDKFLFLPIEVLEFKEGKQTLKVLCSFNNGDESDFIEDPLVVFDGVMRLRQKENLLPRDIRSLGTGLMWEKKIVATDRDLQRIYYV